MTEIPIITIGEMVIDMIHEGGDPQVLGDRFLAVPGGAPANVAIGVSRLGVTAGFIGIVGKDYFGDQLVRVLRENSVDTGSVFQADDGRTTEVKIFPGDDGKKQIEYSGAPAHKLLSPEHIIPDYFKGVKFLHFCSVSLAKELTYQATMKAVRIAQERGAIISFDPNHRPPAWSDQELARQRIWEGIRKADIIKISDEELPFIAEDDDTEKGVNKILAHSDAEIVIATMAEKGAYYKTRRGFEAYIQGFQVEVVEVTGAGDAFSASVLADIHKRGVTGNLHSLSENDWRGVITRANGAGALAVTKRGAIPALPTEKELNDFLNNR